MDFKAEFEAFAEQARQGEVSPEAARAILFAETWFTQRQDQLKKILAHPDKDLKFECDDGDIVVKANSELHRGFRLGVYLALEFMGEFPIAIVDREDEA